MNLRQFKQKSSTNTTKKQSAFTLIELLVVISIIGILIAIGTVSYQKTARLSRDSKRRGDLEQIRQALETYRSENGFYPYPGQLEVYTQNATLQSILVPNFMQKTPEDAKYSGGYYYRYEVDSTTPIQYSLCASLEVDPSQTLNRCTGNQCGNSGSILCNYEVENP